MPTHPIYDLLLEGVSDELERKVLMALIRRAGQRVSRPELVMEVHGVSVLRSELGSSWEDRQNRVAIKRLQSRGYPIVASSGQAGYLLGGEEKDLDEYLAELGSRQARIVEKMGHLRKARKWMPFIREWIAEKLAQQPKLF